LKGDLSQFHFNTSLLKFYFKLYYNKLYEYR